MVPDLPSAVINLLNRNQPLIQALGQTRGLNAGDPLAISGNTKIWLYFPEGRPTPPWLVYNDIGESTEFFSEGGYLSDGMFQISVFAVKRNDIYRFGKLVYDALNDANLTFADSFLMELRHASTSTRVEEEGYPGFKALYHRIVEFHYKVQSSI